MNHIKKTYYHILWRLEHMLRVKPVDLLLYIKKVK